MKKERDVQLIRNLIYSLVLFGQIKTTKSRAKLISGLVDKLVNKVKKGTVSAGHEVLEFLPQKEVAKKLTKEIIPLLTERTSGYTRIVKIGERKGDRAMMVLMEWVKDEGEKGKKEEKEIKEETLQKFSKVPKAKNYVKNDKNK